MTHTFDFYHAALKAKSKRDLPPIHEGDPQPGFYRMRWAKDGPWVPVAVWEDNGTLVGWMDGKNADFDKLSDRWTFYAQNPVEEQHWREVASGKAEWWDAVPTAGVGHNSGDDGEQDKHALLTSQLADLEKQADAVLETPVETEEEAEKRAALAKGLDKIGSDAEKTRKAEKQPHLDAGKAVDAKWNSVRNAAKDKSGKLKRTLDAFMREQERLKREEAERLRREAMDMAKRSDDQDAVVDKMAEAQQIETAKTTVGTTGAKVRLRTVVDAVIIDFDKVINDPNIKNHPDFRAYVLTLAKRAIANGFEIEGVERREREEAA